MKKIKCKTKTTNSNNVRVRIIRAPIVDTAELRNIIMSRVNAIIL
ncbi:MAG: hypothetical protein ABH881_01845 [bacterium]